MSENRKKGELVKLLRHLDAIPVENPAKPGTPDVEFIGGWIEVKFIRAWPVRSDTIVRVDHYTPQQRVFAKRRAGKGGNIWLVLVVGNEWLLFRGEDAAEYLGTLTAEGLYDLSVGNWTRKPRREELEKCLT